MVTSAEVINLPLQPNRTELGNETSWVNEEVLSIRGIAEISGGMVAYERLKPNIITDPTDVVIVPGFVGIKPAYDKLGQAFARQGREVVTLRPVRTQRFLNAVHPRHLLHPLLLQSQAVWAVMKDIHDDDGVDRFDLWCHSLGGPVGCSTAEHKPEYIRSINLVGSAGMDGHTPFSLAQRLYDAGLEIGKTAPGLDIDRLRTARHVAYYTLLNPFRTTAEALAVSGIDNRPSVQRIRNLGIKVARTQLELDPFFPTAHITDEDKAAVDTFRFIPGLGHLGPQTEPELVARDSILAFDQLLAA